MKRCLILTLLAVFGIGVCSNLPALVKLRVIVLTDSGTSALARNQRAIILVNPKTAAHEK